MICVDYLHPMNSSFEIFRLAVCTDSNANRLKSHFFATAKAFIARLAIFCFQLTFTSLLFYLFIFSFVHKNFSQCL